MIAGGNPTFREFLDYYGFNKSTPINITYRSKVAIFYREMLNVFA